MALGEMVEHYIKTDTNHALMITGAWGTGKTYYYKHSIVPKIQALPVPSKPGKNFKSVIVSLFGINSVADIQVQILLSLSPIFKTKGYKIVSNIAKPLVKGIAKPKGFGDLYESVSSFKIDTESLISFDEIVICFDDLERHGKSLDLKELVGFINSLVEGHNVKIIIIANEAETTNDEFTNLKEKVIGNIIQFIPDDKVSLNSIIETKFKDSETYQAFLQDNRELILAEFFLHSQNLRILSFALSYFKEIFSVLKYHIVQGDKVFPSLNDVLIRILKFTLVISNEYRTGKLSFQNREKLDSIDPHTLLARKIWKKEEKANEEPYRFKFLDKYFNNGNYEFYATVYNFLTGGTLLSYTDLHKEIIEKLFVDEEEELPHFVLLNELGRREGYITISDEKYIDKTQRLLQYVKEDQFKLVDYIGIFQLIIRLDNPLKIDPAELESIVIAGLWRGKDNYQYIPYLFDFLTHEPTYDYASNMDRIKNESIKLNEQLRLERNHRDQEHWEKLFYDNIDDFISEVDKKYKEYTAFPIFNTFDVMKFFEHYSQLSNEVRYKIYSFFTHRYTQENFSYLRDEYDFLKELYSLLLHGSELLDTKPVTLMHSRWLQNRLSNFIDWIEKNPKTQNSQ